MPKVSIADKMGCPLRLQYHRNRLFRPIKVDCLQHKHIPVETQPNNIHLYHVYLALDFKFMILQNINNFDTFSSTRSSMILQLRFKIRKLQNTMRAIPPFHSIDFVLFLSSAVWYTNGGILSYSTLYRTDVPTPRGESFMTVAMYGGQCF